MPAHAHASTFLLALAAGCVAATVDLPPSSPAVRILARAWEPTPGDIQWSWSGSGAQVRFEGTSCSALLAARGAIYRVLVDGAETRILDLTSGNDTIVPLASGLPAGPHLVEIRQRTEASHVALTRFHGFRIEGTPGIAPSPSPRRVEFYGNSITCGYGILDSVASHSFSLQTEDEGSTFAALAADSLGAERRVVCWSGKGALQNYGGDTANPTLPELHRQILPWDAQHLWDFSKWTPHAVVVDLGTNDYSTVQPDSGRFHDAYRAFVDSLHAHYPDAHLVLVDGPMLSDDYPSGSRALSKVRAHLDTIAAEESRRGVSISHLRLSPQGNLGYGADWHPSRAQARLNAGELAAHLGAVLGWTGAPVGTSATRRGRGYALAASGEGWILSSPGGTVLRSARLADARGSVRTLSVPTSGKPLVVPSARRISWLLLEDGEGAARIAVPPLRGGN